MSNVAIILFYGLKLIKGEVWATLAGNVVATFPSYYLNRTWTWAKRGKSHLRKEIIPFWTMSLLGIGFSTILAFVARHVVQTHHWHHLVNTLIVVIVNLVSFAIFWVLKLKVFNRIFRVNELAEIDEHLTLEESGDIGSARG